MENKRLKIYTVCRLLTDATFLFIFEMSCREINRRNWKWFPKRFESIQNYFSNEYSSSYYPSKMQMLSRPYV